MNYRNRFNTVLMTSILLMSCAARDKGMIPVESDLYSSNSCWFSNNGKFSALLVLADNKSTLVPYFISSKCFVKDNYSNYGESVLHHLNEIRMDDTYGNFSKAFPGKNVSTNAKSDQPMPSSMSKLYFFEAKVDKIIDSPFTVYSPKQILLMENTGYHFEDFLGMTLEQRNDVINKR